MTSLFNGSDSVSISILGTPYTIAIKGYDDDPSFKADDLDGYCDFILKRIVICDMSTHPEWGKEEPGACERLEKQAARHEIVHAFLRESGLSECSYASNGSWACNEEMVDWFATQGPKIVSVWQALAIL